MFCTNSSKICCSFVKNKIFEKSKMAAKTKATSMPKLDLLSAAVWKIYGGGGGSK